MLFPLSALPTDGQEATTLEFEAARRTVSSRMWRTCVVLPEEVPLGAYRVADGRMEEVEGGMRALAKRAAKLGLPTPIVTVLRVEDAEVVAAWHDRWYRTGEIRRFHVLRPDCGTVVLPGWQFVATIEHLSEEGNLLRTVPSFEGSLPVAYRTDRATCDHCRTHRRRTAKRARRRAVQEGLQYVIKII